MLFILGGAVLFLSSVILTKIITWRAHLNGGWYRRYCTHIKTSLKGKTVVITGGNAGIGRETAIDLARRGARVIIACRNEDRAKRALQEIRSKSGSNNVDYYHLELSDLHSIRNFAQKFLQEEERLDILINNAGLGRSAPGLRTKQGYDIPFGVNHFGHFLLTMLLLDRLKKCAPSRIVTLSSILHMTVSHESMDFSRGDKDFKYPGLNGYRMSKLANILFTKELAKQLTGTGVTAFCLHPGFIRSNIFRTSYANGSPLWRYFFMSILARFCGYGEEAGAQTSIYCAIEESLVNLSGSYFDNCQLGNESDLAKDDGLARKLWEVSCEATGVNDRKL